MSEINNLQELKIRAQRSVLEDGLLDITMGVYLVLSGLFLNNRLLVINYIWLPIGLVLVDVIRGKYIYPRTGYAKLKIPTREILIVMAITVIGILLTGLLVAFVAPDLNVIKGGWNGVASYALAVITTAVFCVLAYRFSLPRWYVQGVLFSLAFILYRSVKSPFIISGLGGIVIIIGVIVLVGFLQKNPIPRGREVARNETLNVN